MTPDAYRRLRESIGSEDLVARLLDVSVATLRNREKGASVIKLEAGYALEYVAQQEKRRPSQRVRRLKPTGRGGNGDRKRKAERRADSFARVYGSEERVRWISQLPCIVPGCRLRLCENAHTVGGGMGRKGPYTSIVPLCAGPGGHHAEQHRIGIRSFATKYGLDLPVLAAGVQRAWERRNA